MNQSNKKGPQIEASYIAPARRAIVASRLKKKAREDEIQAKRETATAMHSFHVTEFEAEVEGSRFNVKLERPWARRINVRKLYVLVQSGEITLDEFFDCIEAPVNAVEETLGEEKAVALSDTYKKGLDLVITQEG